MFNAKGFDRKIECPACKRFAQGCTLTVAGVYHCIRKTSPPVGFSQLGDSALGSMRFVPDDYDYDASQAAYEQRLKEQAEAEGRQRNAKRRAEIDQRAGRQGLPANEPGGKPAKRDPASMFDKIAKEKRPMTPEERNWIANKLSLPLDIFDLLDVEFFVDESRGKPAFVFPERDVLFGDVIGYTLRYADGMKRNHGRRGLSLATCWCKNDEDSDVSPIFLCEGASDTLALLAMGLNAVGRPSNTGGVALLVELLKGVDQFRPIVVLGENDKKESGLWPGRDGAESTARNLMEKLGREVYVLMPPEGVKDVRSMLEQERAKREANPKDRKELFVIGQEFAAYFASHDVKNRLLPPIQTTPDGSPIERIVKSATEKRKTAAARREAKSLGKLMDPDDRDVCTITEESQNAAYETEATSDEWARREAITAAGLRKYHPKLERGHRCGMLISLREKNNPTKRNPLKTCCRRNVGCKYCAMRNKYMAADHLTKILLPLGVVYRWEGPSKEAPAAVQRVKRATPKSIDGKRFPHHCATVVMGDVAAVYSDHPFDGAVEIEPLAAVQAAAMDIAAAWVFGKHRRYWTFSRAWQPEKYPSKKKMEIDPDCEGMGKADVSLAELNEALDKCNIKRKTVDGFSDGAEAATSYVLDSDRMRRLADWLIFAKQEGRKPWQLPGWRADLSTGPYDHLDYNAVFGGTARTNLSFELDFNLKTKSITETGATVP